MFSFDRAVDALALLPLRLLGGGASRERGLRPGWRAAPDAVGAELLSHPEVPGFVLKARRGPHSYERAFGEADVERGAAMELDAQFRCFSMTKVLTSAVAMMLVERGHLSHFVGDVFQPEPLSASSALWEHPKVTVTPHNSAVTQPGDVADAFAANLARYEEGGVDALRNVFNWEAGY